MDKCVIILCIKEEKHMQRMKKVLAALLLIVMVMPTVSTQAAKVKLNKTKISICIKDTYTLKVKNTKKKVKWSTSKKSVVTVTSKGKITGKKAGSATITAKIGTKKYRCKVTVRKAALNKTSKTLRVGDTYKLSVKDSQAKKKWTTSNSKIASVSSSGTVSAKKIGTATIKVKVSSGYLSCKVKVINTHSYTSKVTRAATCSHTGMRRYTCNICGYYYDKAIAKTAHKWDAGYVEEEATREHSGTKVYHCTACDTKKIEDIPMLSPEADSKDLVLDKETYKEGELLQVTAKGSGDAWVGIYAAEDSAQDDAAIFWYSVAKDGKTSGNTYALQRDGKTNDSRNKLYTLPAGDYKVILFKDNDYEVLAHKAIKITANSYKRLKTDKTTYSVGEDINVSADGYQADWVGLYKKEDTIPTDESIYWYNIAMDGNTPGKAFKIQNGTKNPSRSDSYGLLAGDYKLVLFANGGYTQLDSLDIKITGDVPLPAKPASISYDLKNSSDGMANGTVKVKTTQSGKPATDIVMYWADANGKLADYTSLAKFKVTGETTTFNMYENTVIPKGATRLLAYTENSYGISTEYAEVALPAGSDYTNDPTDLKSEFQVLSDIHITTAAGAVGDMKYDNEHFREAMKDIAANSPSSSGVFINGDMADTGKLEEYQNMKTIIDSVAGTPNIFMSVGNHDLASDYNQQVALFKQYVGIFTPGADTTNVYYDQMVNGYHNIFLGGEKSGLHAYLSEAQLNWLDAKLAADKAADPTKPVFVYLHQSLTDTVAGSFAGQGWNGVENEAPLRAILKKYPQVVLFNGHSHWELNSVGCMHARDNELPSIFNTASVGYLWTSYNTTAGEGLVGSHGYYVRVYSDRVEVLGRDFVNKKWIPSACFVEKNYQP